MVARLGEAAGLDFPAHPHMLRHACGYQLANDGQDTRSLQLYLGHKNIQHTVRYTQLNAGRFTRFVSPVTVRTELGESRGGISPPRAPRTVREPLGSYGSRCSADVERLRLVHRAPPVTSCPWGAAEQRSPFGPVPLQHLHPSYGLLRPCAPHRYSGPRGSCRLDVSLRIGTTGSHVPYKSLIRLRAA
jgi:hypothetical protein